MGVAVVPDGSGGTLFFWSDARAGEGVEIDVYGQRFDAEGSRLWVLDGRPVVTSPGNQWLPFSQTMVVADGFGGAFVAWAQTPDNSTLDLYVQHMSGDGDRLWDPDGVPLVVAPGDQPFAFLCPDGAGGVYAAWTDERTGSNRDVYVQHLDATGEALWGTDGMAVRTGPLYQSPAGICTDGQGGMILIWDEGPTPVYSHRPTYGQRFDAAANPLWGPDGVRLVYGDDIRGAWSVISDGARGAYFAVKVDGACVRIQRIDPDGTPLFGAAGIIVSDDWTEKQWLWLVRTEDGGVAASWFEVVSWTDVVHAQKISADAERLWGATGLRLTDSGGDQRYPCPASDGTGGLIVAWTDYRDLADIYAQRVNAAGQRTGAPNGVPVCTNLDNQFGVVLAPAGPGRAVAAWQDERPSSYSDIYAQGFYIPDLIQPIEATVEPWDTYGQVLVSPGSQSGVDQVTITLERNGVPVANAEVEIDLSLCSGLCVDAPANGLSGFTDAFGTVILDPRVGGCEACSVFVRADGDTIRRFGRVVSPDWTDDGADGQVDDSDAAWLQAQYGSNEPCADYDGNGLVNTIDLMLFGSALHHDVNSHLCVDLPTLIAWWKFDEGSGSEVHDASGYGNDGIAVGPEWVPGLGTALEIVGTDIVKLIPPACDDPIEGAFTVTAFVRWHGASEYGRTSTILDGRSNDGGFYLGIRTDSHPVLYTYGSRSVDQSVVGVHTIPTDVWTHLACVFDHTGSVMRVYLNGELDAEAPATAPYDDSSNSAAIGNNHWAPGDGQWAPLNGAVDDVRLYSRVLSGAEIMDLASWAVSGLLNPGGRQPEAAAPLLSATPNPFGVSTMLRLVLPKAARTRIELFRPDGGRLRTLWDGALEAGPHVFTWDGRDAGGKRLPPGIYLARFTSGSRREVIKLHLIR
jgi:hypothetical protein